MPTNRNLQNRVTVEGYVARAWEYRGTRFIRLAHNRFVRGQRFARRSDYMTVRLECKAPYLQEGDLVRVEGTVYSRMIKESLGRILEKSGYRLELTPEIANLQIARPTTEIAARHVSLINQRDTRSDRVERMMEALTPKAVAA